MPNLEDNPLVNLALTYLKIEVNHSRLERLNPESHLLKLCNPKNGYRSQDLPKLYPPKSEDPFERFVEVQVSYLADLRQAIRNEIYLRRETSKFPDSLPLEPLAA